MVGRVPADRVAYIFTNNRDYELRKHYESRLAAMTVDRLKAAMGQVNVQSVAEKRAQAVRARRGRRRGCCRFGPGEIAIAWASAGSGTPQSSSR
jgi:hypothetical protein